MTLEDLGILLKESHADAREGCESVDDCESTGNGNEGNDVCVDCN